TYEYDFRNRQAKTTLPDPDGSGTGNPLVSPVYETQYDNLGRTTRQSDGTANGITTLGHYTTIVYSINTTNHTAAVTTTYPDADGSSSTTTDVPVTVATSNSRGLVISQTDMAGRETTFTYDGAGRQTKVTQPDPNTSDSNPAPHTDYAYDGVG